VATVAAVLVAVVIGVAIGAVDRSDHPTGVSTDPSGRAGEERWGTFPPAPVAGRAGATAVASRDEMLVWGGRDQDVFDDGAAYSFDAGTWRTVAQSPLSARSSAVSVWTGREMVIWGGADGASAVLGDGAAYDPATDSWRPLPSPPAEVGFVGAIDGSTGAAWTGDELVLVGAPDPAGVLQNRVAILDPENGWRAVTALSPPPGGGTPRQRSAFWTGSEVLVVTVTDLEPVTVDRLDPTDGTWGGRIVTEAPGLDTDPGAAALVGNRLIIAGHYKPGAVVDLDDGTSRPLLPSNSVLRFPALVAGGALTVGDRWLDLADEQWEDAASVPRPHGEFPVAVTDGEHAYYWGDSACGPAASCTGVIDPKIGIVWTPPFPDYARDIEAVFPSGTFVVSVRSSGDGSYDEIDLHGADNARFTLMLYREFDRTEVEANGTRLPAAQGTAWTGANDPDLTSIYFLGTNGVGMWIGSEKPGGSPLPQARLVDLAEAVAAIPSLFEAL
jgi:hypothetical protein